MKKQLTKKQFIFMMFNYIVGFGFISTIGGVIEIGPWGIVVFFLTALIAMGVALIFSRLTNEFPNVEGSSYGFAKKVHGKKMIFFQGWNQFIQGPILAASTPLFLESVLSTDPINLNHWIGKAISISIYVILVLVSVLPLVKSFKFISYFGMLKWVIFGLGLILITILSGWDNNFSNSWLSSNKVTIGAITGTTLSFMFAFGGIEGIATVTKDVKAKNFRKILLGTFFAILSVYFIIYLVMTGMIVPSDTSQMFKSAFNGVIGLTGTILFVIGFIANKSSATIGSSLVNARNLGPLAKDGFLPKWIGTEEKGVYKKATFLSAGLSILSMILFEIIPEVTNTTGSAFLEVISIGTIAFLIQYLFTGITIVKLMWKKKIRRAPLWERVAIGFMFIAIILVLLTQMVPPISGDLTWVKGKSALIKDVSYACFVLLGYLTWYLTNKLKNRA